VVLWYRGADVLRVTARKNAYNEVEEFICNTCRFDKKATSDWVIDGPRKIDQASVISQNQYASNTVIPAFTKTVTDGYTEVNDTLPEHKQLAAKN
jgi:NADH-quinone oxidoreductase subunit G